jgi:hypothetical protein
MQLTDNALWAGLFPGESEGRHMSLSSSDVIGEELCAERLLKPACLGLGFEGLDFIPDASVGFAARPFGLGRHWLADIWEAAELQAQFIGAGAGE